MKGTSTQPSTAGKGYRNQLAGVNRQFPDEVGRPDNAVEALGLQSCRHFGGLMRENPKTPSNIEYIAS